MRNYFRLARVAAALWIGAGGMGLAAAEDERLRDRLAPELRALARDRDERFALVVAGGVRGAERGGSDSSSGE